MKTPKYTIFKTSWGHFGLLAGQNGLIRTHLPQPNADLVAQNLLKDIPHFHRDRGVFRPLQEQICAYFDGVFADFAPGMYLDLSIFTGFCGKIFTALQTITIGQTISYAKLGDLAEKPRSARAVGNILAKNPIPLIIPCHRVIRADGKIGGFSATGGVRSKYRLLKHEKQA